MAQSHATDGLTINNHVLGYIVGHIHQRPREQIKSVALTHFSKEEIIISKSLLWEKCDSLNVLDKMVNHVDSATRGAEHAVMMD